MNELNTKYIITRNENGEVLKHHGIDGQKWGQRNGPPYPLDYDDHSAKEKKSNPKSLIDGDSKTGKKSGKIKEFAKKHKKGIVIGTVVTGAAVGAGIALGARYIDKKKKEYKETALSDWVHAWTVRNKGANFGDEAYYGKYKRDFDRTYDRIKKMKYRDLASYINATEIHRNGGFPVSPKGLL